MLPVTAVLLDGPDLTRELRDLGLSAIVPDARGEGPAFVAATARALAALAPEPPLVLVAWGAAGPLVPSIALSQRAARRPVTGYVFVDTALPSRTPHDHMPQPSDWPDAPCAYVRTPDSGEQTTRALREAELRTWPTRTPLTSAVPQALHDLLDAW